MNFEDQTGFVHQAEGKIIGQPYFLTFIPQYWCNYSNFPFSQNFIYVWEVPYFNYQQTQVPSNDYNDQNLTIPPQIRNSVGNQRRENIQQSMNENFNLKKCAQEKEDRSFHKYFDPNDAPVLTSLQPLAFRKTKRDSNQSLLSQNDPAQGKSQLTSQELISENYQTRIKYDPLQQPEPSDCPFIICKSAAQNSKKKLLSRNYYERNTSRVIPREIDPLPILTSPQYPRPMKNDHPTKKRSQNPSQIKMANKFTSIKYESASQSEEDPDNSQLLSDELFDSELSHSPPQDFDYQNKRFDKKKLRSMKQDGTHSKRL